MRFYNTSRVGGNIISLIDKDFAELDYSTYKVYGSSFTILFSNEKNLVDAS